MELPFEGAIAQVTSTLKHRNRLMQKLRGGHVRSAAALALPPTDGKALRGAVSCGKSSTSISPVLGNRAGNCAWLQLLCRWGLSRLLRALRLHFARDTKVIAFSIYAGLSDELTRGKRARAICISPLVCMMRTSRRRRQSTRAIRCGERETVTRPSMAQLAGQRGTCGAFTRCGTFWHVSCSSLEWTKDV
jgi:hypothetical protein